MQTLPRLGPIGELDVTEWIGTPPAATLAELRGQVLAIEAFQMLCPGCVLHGLPQATRLGQIFGPDLVVLGLHTVFEHHDAMQVPSLRAFLYEFRIPFPVAVDRPQGSGLPATMERLALHGTPSLLLVDRQGELRWKSLGTVDDLRLGALVAQLVTESPAPDPGAVFS